MNLVNHYFLSDFLFGKKITSMFWRFGILWAEQLFQNSRIVLLFYLKYLSRSTNQNSKISTVIHAFLLFLYWISFDFPFWNVNRNLRIYPVGTNWNWNPSTAPLPSKTRIAFERQRIFWIVLEKQFCFIRIVNIFRIVFTKERVQRHHPLGCKSWINAATLSTFSFVSGFIFFLLF